MNTIAFSIVACLFVWSVLGDGCVKPQVSPRVFISSETVLTSDVVIVGEFSVNCANRPQSLSFLAEFNGEFIPVTQSIDGESYQSLSFLAEFNGEFIPVTQSIDGESYQFTITKKPKDLTVSVYKVNVYDEQAAGLLRKAQASGKTTADANVKPTFTIPVDYQGPNKGLIIPTEFLALGGGITFSLLAFHARSQISN
ncbi:translocon-associated protein subunit delta-like isoform X2 [Convolutriloba macropyga]|uniref:translocon-associated protein subunit delta-like isoform X2 n=1 Tax=Convolutriloba macropyga TaxID=536237 RepID=UPI003F526E02